MDIGNDLIDKLVTMKMEEPEKYKDYLKTMAEVTNDIMRVLSEVLK